MRDELEQHILSIFAALNINAKISIYNTTSSGIPFALPNLSQYHEFLVQCELYDTASIKVVKKLSNLINKEIFTDERAGVQYLYWCEGEEIEHTQLKINDSSPKHISTLKTFTSLPKWLDDFIFKEMKGNYSPDYNKYSYNLNLSHNDNLTYLGTYFPRSYAESFCIFDDLFKNTKVQKRLSYLSEVSILSIGSGTGGDLFGLLTAIEKYFKTIKKIQIICLDGNSHSSIILLKILERYKLTSNKLIEVKTETALIQDFFSGKVSLPTLESLAFNFIVSSKMICELISNGYSDSFYTYCKKLIPSLDYTGFFLLLDVTTKHDELNYNPVLMNHQINRALKELRDYKTLIPLPCNKYEEICDKECFTQQTFEISHTQKKYDKSKVTYRIICKAEFCNDINNIYEDNQYIIKRDPISAENNEICYYTKNSNTLCDGFKLI